jgi:hypothetical protein
LFQKRADVELPNASRVVHVVLLAQQLLQVRQTHRGKLLSIDISLWLQHFVRVPRWACESTGERHFLSALVEQLTFKNQAFVVGKRPRLAQNHRSIVQHLGIWSGLHGAFFHLVNQARRIDQIASHRREEIVDVNHHGLAFNHGLSGGRAVVAVALPRLERIFCRLGSSLHPLLQIVVLILQGVSQFMSQNWFLAIERNPIQQRNRFGFEVVVPGDLLAGGFDQKFLQIEIARQETEFLHAQLFLGKPLREFLFGQRAPGIFLHVGLAYEAPLHCGMFGHSTIFCSEREDFVYGLEELFRIRVGHADFFRSVLTQLASNIAQARRIGSLLAERKLGE